MGDGDEGAPDGRIPVSRLFALLDGVSAIAMTILVLGISLPAGLTGAALSSALADVGQQILYFLLSVAVIGVFWHGHHQILVEARHVDLVLFWLNLVFLGLIALIPFPTAVLSHYSNEVVGPGIYGLTIGLTCLVELIMWLYIARPGGPSARPIPRRQRRGGIVSSVVPASIFLGSAVVALVSPFVAMLCWLLVIPLHWFEVGVPRRPG